MKTAIAIAALTAGALSAQSGTEARLQAARQAEARECIQCHSLRLIHSQRLSAAGWGKELDKMAGWGTVIKDRQVLLDYLSTEYPDTKPVPEDPKSSDGRKH